MSDSGANVVDYVWAQVRREPSRPAVRWQGRYLTYGELWDQAGRVASRLGEHGVKTGDVVGICAWRSADLIAAIVGILRAGCAYLPLDPAYPEDRLRYMLDQADAAVLVGHEESAAALCGDRPLVTLESLDAAVPLSEASRAAGDIAYVMFTSGSTGVPKGVMQTHRALGNLIAWQLADSGVGEGEITAQFAPISFDVSFQEIFATLAAGGILLCLDDDDRRDPIRLWRRLAAERVSRLYLPFVMLQTLALFVDELGDDLPPMREVITAGEQLRCDPRIKQLFARLPGARLVNQYGPTETHVCTRYLLPEDPESWPLLPPIGTAVDGVRLYVLDEAGNPTVAGAAGELHVAGVAVARGYVGQPELTQQRFRAEPGRSDLMYATGDVVEWREGELYYLGRNDDQIKINGIRIEPAEVEFALLSFAEVREAAVVAHTTDDGGTRLVGFVRGDPELLQVDRIRQRMVDTMPAHLVPHRVLLTPAMPTTPSGKLDRAALQERVEHESRLSDPAFATGLAAIWWSQLSMSGQRVENLRDSGVDSLAAARVSAKIAEQFRVNVPIDEVLAAKSLDHLADIVAASPPSPRLSMRSAPGPRAVTAMQQQILVGELLEDESPSRWVLIELDVAGPFDTRRAELALHQLIRRHDALRVRFELTDTGFTLQYVADAQPVVHHVATADLRSIRTRLYSERYELGDVAAPVSMIVRTDTDRHRVMIRVHHACCDGWSVTLLSDEFAALYSGVALPPAVQQWQLATPNRSADEDVRYWLDRLRPVADRKPFDWGNGGVRAESPALRRLPFALTPTEIKAVRMWAKAERTTPFAIMLASWACATTSDDPTICVAIPVSTRQTVDESRCVGLFLNTVILVLPSRAGTFSELVERIQHEVSQALQHSAVPLTDLLEQLTVARKSAHHPIAQMMFTLQPSGQRFWTLPDGARMELRADGEIPEATRFDLWFNLDDRGTEIVGWIDHDANIVNEARVSDVLERWRRALTVR